MIPAIILDTETTDKDPKTCEVMEVAWKEFSFAGESQEQGWSRYGIANGLKWGALAAHHILPSEVEGLPLCFAVEPPIPVVAYLIGHNVDFDWEAIGRPAAQRICTLAMMRHLVPELDSHTLTACVYYIRGAIPETRDLVRGAHSAAADIGLCRIVLDFVVERQGITTLDELYVFSEEARIPTLMTFGKFKGEPISSVDRGYANWYRKQPDTDPYLLEAFRRAGIL